MPLVLDGTNGVSGVDGTASNPAIEGTDSNTGIFYPAADTVAIGTGGTERLRVVSAGDVGVGTSTPATISNRTVLSINNASNGGALNLLVNGTETLRLLTDNSSLGYVYNVANQPLVFGTNNTERARIQSTGNFLIGTTTGSYNLTVAGNIQCFGTGVTSTLNFGSLSTNSFAQIEYDDSNGDFNIKQGRSYNLKFFVNTTERARISAGGDFLVACTSSTNTASTGSRLYTDGAVWSTMAASTNGGGSGWLLYSTGAAANRFYVGLGGTVFATSTTITAISDIRFKENIQDIDAGLDKIMALKPRKFDWKEGKGKDKKGDRGWIAQEFEQVFPEMIDTWLDPAPEGEEPYKAVNADLIPILVKAIQELNAKVEAQAAEIAVLKGTA